VLRSSVKITDWSFSSGEISGLKSEKLLGHQIGFESSWSF